VTPSLLREGLIRGTAAHGPTGRSLPQRQPEVRLGAPGRVRTPCPLRICHDQGAFRRAGITIGEGITDVPGPRRRPWDTRLPQDEVPTRQALALAHAAWALETGRGLPPGGLTRRRGSLALGYSHCRPWSRPEDASPSPTLRISCSELSRAVGCMRMLAVMPICSASARSVCLGGGETGHLI
jgi:hypothetical protein